MASEKPEQTTNLWKIVDSFLARCSEWALDLVQTKLVMLLGGFTVSICSFVRLLFYKRQDTTRARMSPITRMGFEISASFLSMTILFSLVFFFFFSGPLLFFPCLSYMDLNRVLAYTSFFFHMNRISMIPVIDLGIGTLSTTKKDICWGGFKRNGLLTIRLIVVVFFSFRRLAMTNSNA